MTYDELIEKIKPTVNFSDTYIFDLVREFGHAQFEKGYDHGYADALEDQTFTTIG